MLERFNVVDLIEVTAAVDNHVDAKAVRHVVAQGAHPQSKGRSWCHFRGWCWRRWSAKWMMRLKLQDKFCAAVLLCRVSESWCLCCKEAWSPSVSKCGWDCRFLWDPTRPSTVRESISMHLGWQQMTTGSKGECIMNSTAHNRRSPECDDRKTTLQIIKVFYFTLYYVEKSDDSHALMHVCLERPIYCSCLLFSPKVL